MEEARRRDQVLPFAIKKKLSLRIGVFGHLLFYLFISLDIFQKNLVEIFACHNFK